jgi:hypothetical protein
MPGGPTLSPGVEMLFTQTFRPGGPHVGADLVRAYFDSGRFRAGRRDPAYIVIAYAICDVKQGVEQPPTYEAAQVDTLVNHLQQGGLRLDRLDSSHRASLSKARVAGDPPLFDLVAANRALVRLKEDGYRGPVEALSDGKEVIEFMNGTDSALTLRVGEVDLAPDLRREILETASVFSQVEWGLVPSARNRAGSTLRGQLDGHLRGFRKGTHAVEVGEKTRKEWTQAPGRGK